MEVYLADCRVSGCLRLLRAQVSHGLHVPLDTHVVIHDRFYTQHIKIYLQLLYCYLLKDHGLPVGCAVVFTT